MSKGIPMDRPYNINNDIAGIEYQELRKENKRLKTEVERLRAALTVIRDETQESAAYATADQALEPKS